MKDTATIRILITSLGTGVNKQRAIWCNRYVLDHAATIWHGHIRPGGTLEPLLRSHPLSPPQYPPPHHSLS